MEQIPSQFAPAVSLAGPVPVERGVFGVPVVEQYWRAARAHKWVIAGIILAAVILGLVVTLLMTPVYTATSRIEISRTSENVTNTQGVENDDASKNLEFYQTQYSLLESRSLADRVARSLNLANDPVFLKSFDIGQERAAPADAARPARTDQRSKAIANVLLSYVDVSPIRGSSLVDVSFTSPNPALSARIANSWTQQFIQASLDRRFASTADARKFLEDQLQKLRARLEQSEADLVNYASQKRIIPLSTSQGPNGETQTEQTLVASDLQALNGQLAEATAARIQAESAYRSAGAAAGNNTTIDALRQQRALVQADYAKILTQFEPSYPAAQALKSQIDQLSQSIRAEEARSHGEVASAYRQALAREQTLRAKVDQLKNEMINERRDSIQYAIDQREVDTNRQLYDALLQRYKEIGVAPVGSNNVAVVDAANPPQSPSRPKVALNLALALLFGIAAAAGVVVLLEYMDKSLKDPDDVKRLLGIPLLGGIPRVAESEMLMALDDRKSEISEAYLSVKTNLSFLTDHGVPRSLVVTSTAPNEGKSVSALAIARTLARSGSRVLLLDGDMRNPSVGELTGARSDRGLTNYLAGQDDWRSVTMATPYENLDVLIAGPTPPNAAELLSGGRMHQLLQELRGTYDHIVVDSPPVLGLADAPLLSSMVEGVILTVEANQHRLRAIENSLRRLVNANAHVVGAIVTKLDERNSSYGYGQYGYGYGYGDKTAADVG